MARDWAGWMMGGLFLLFFLTAINATAQRSSISPNVLYPGENVITVTAPGGIRSVRVEFADSVSMRYTEVRKIGLIGGCPNTTDIEFTLNAASERIVVPLFIEQCSGAIEEHRLQINTEWNLDTVFFPDAVMGEEICRPFQVSLNVGATIGGVPVGGGSIFLDSVSSTDERVSFRYSFPPPIGINRGTTYRYNVCFTADKPGVYTFPVITWIKRDNPAGGYTNYPVADTGVVRVLRERSSSTVTTVEFDSLGIDNPPPVTDPTTFRTIAVPNAVRPKKNDFFVGSYDVIGLTAGYGVADELMVFAGGTPPTPDDWGGVNGDMFGAFGIGIKVGTTLFDKLDLAAGYVYGQSILDKEFTPGETDSKIRAHVPYAAISYGTDDSRVSVTGGYAMKNHQTWFENHPSFGPWREVYDTNAAFGAVGGDYRFARHWKVASEVAYMQTVDVLPVILTARYFTNSFAIDLGAVYAGIALNGKEAPPIPVFPMLSGVFVF